MEIFILIIIGVLLSVLLTNFRQEVKKNMQVLNQNIINVRKEVYKLQEGGFEPKETAQQKEKPKAAPLKKLEVSGQRLKPQAKPEITKNPVTQKLKPVAKVSTPEATSIQVQKKVETTTVKPQHSQAVKKPKKDYEKLIGENWLNKIGIGILVIGIGFFVKYAIDQNWIGEVGRVGIGMLTGGILIGIAHFLRKKYRAFSSVLIGGGISVFYYTISIAYHDYSIFNQSTAFVIMVGITILSAFMSVLYDRKELAIITLIGGFTSPFMVQGETGNYVVFFTYIAILNSGMLVLSYFKNWSILTKLATGFTVLFFGAWALTTDLAPAKPAYWSMVFATIYFVQFLSMNLIYNFVRKIKYNAWEFIQITGITALYYGLMTYILETHTYAVSSGGFTIILSVFFIALSVFARLRKGTDPALVYSLVGKAVTFLTITPLLLFNGDYMTIFWGIEAVVILALGQFANMKILKNASILLTIATLIGLAKDWILNYLDYSQSLAPFSNGTFFTGLFVVATLVISFILVRREKEPQAFAVPTSQYHFMIGTLIFTVGYLVVLFELLYQLIDLNFNPGAGLVLWLFHGALILTGLVIAHLRKSALMEQIFFVIGALFTVGYLILAQTNNFSILEAAVRSINKFPYYALHFVLVAMAVCLLFMLKGAAKRIFEDQKHIRLFIAVLSVVGLVIATVELDQIMGYALAPTYELHKVLSHTQTEGYTILWGLYSFALMMRGMQKKSRVLRILALILFSITLIKLFVFDIQNISEAGKIIAFISLGALLLVVSFLYQKLKVLIVEGKIE